MIKGATHLQRCALAASTSMKVHKPNVTIFADASHDRTACVAGWGAWIKADGRNSITCGAAMKGAIASAIEAELCALANALTVARLRGVLAMGSVVMMQSDCAVALGIIRGKIDGVEDRPVPGGITITPVRRMKLTKVHLAAVEVIRENIAALSISIITRHVRGHQIGSGRQWVNSEVDRIARQAMRHRRREVLKPTA
jgi:ribonuclease HI